MVILFLFSYLYYSKILELDDEQQSSNELTMEGIPNAVALFLLTWIITFTFVRF